MPIRHAYDIYRALHDRRVQDWHPGVRETADRVDQYLGYGRRLAGLVASGVASSRLLRSHSTSGTLISKPTMLSQYTNLVNRFVTKKESRKHKHKRLATLARVERDMNVTMKVSKWIRTNTLNMTSSAGQQSMNCLAPLNGLYGVAGSWDDLKALLSDMPMPTATALNVPAGAIFSNKLQILKARAKLELTNTSATNGAYIDIYKYVTTKPSNYGSLSAILSGAVPVTWAAGTALVASGAGLGETPFDLKEIVNVVKILRKDSIFLAPGQSIETGYSTRGFVFKGGDINNESANSEFSYPGHTTGLIVVIAGRVNAAQTAEPLTVTALTTNEYRVKPIMTALSGMTQTAQGF